MAVVWIVIAVAVLLAVAGLVTWRLGLGSERAARQFALARRDLAERMADSAADFRDWIRLGR